MRWSWPRRPGRPLVIGHRGVRTAAATASWDGWETGGSTEPPENTLAAFEAAADRGADGVELDVRVCGSGELVVAHDPTLERVTGGADHRPIAWVPYSELRRLDLGGGAQMPLLAEVLALVRARRLYLNVEMKRDVPSRGAVVAATARLLSAVDPRQPLLVSSFDPLMLVGLGAALAGVPRALLISPDGWYPKVARLARPLAFSAIHPNRTLTRVADVAAWRRGGLLVNVWTVNSPAEARDLAAIGVDGIITDDPRPIRDALS